MGPTGPGDGSVGIENVRPRPIRHDRRAGCAAALLLGALMLLALGAARADATVRTPHVTARLVSEVEAVQPGRPFWAALHFEIIPGWHTYWRNPGDSGSAPRLRWRLPPGFEAGEIQWPYPRRLPAGPFVNFGYSGQAWMLVRITPPADLAVGESVELGLEADWLVCEEACIPESGRFTLALPVSPAPARPSPWAEAMAAARRALPAALPWPARLEAGDDHLRLHVGPGLDARRVEAAWFYPDAYGVVEHAAEQPLTRREDGLTLELARGELRAQSPAPLEGVLVITETRPEAEGGGRLERAFQLTAEPTAPAGRRPPGLAPALLLALGGGLLLNLMPCVFPVLSMKALALVEQARRAPAAVRRQGWVFTAGVLASFLVLAGALLALRKAGEAVGWGFQLQSPGFVLALAWLIFAVGLMLSGLWSFGGRLMGLGQGLAARGGDAGAFFTGVLAVVVATPCTAPFMGAALGYALTLPAAPALAVFLALGAGLALPWLALALWPAAGRRLPAPGPWMERLRQLLAFPMYATAVWLVWVLARQAGAEAVAAALAGMLLIAFAAWLWALPPRGRWRHAVAPLLALALAGLLALPATGRPPGPSAEPAHGEPYSEARLQALRAAGRPVLVNLTADWCITCLVNERLALGSERVRRALRERKVAYLVGDWTRRDPQITRLLERHGRAGVPLYLLYPRGPGAPEILPQLLTEELVLGHLERL